jgi:hypothetical protein
MNLSATIAKMRACGMTAEAILLALECLVLDQTPERSGAARRQAAYRERNALRNKHNGDVTRDVAPSPLVPPLSPTPPNPPYNPPIQSKPTRAKPATELADEWEPDGKTWKLAEQLGFTSQEAWDQLDRMRDWARNAGAKGRKPDWNAAFRNWLKRTADERKLKPQASVQRNSNANAVAILDAAFDQAIARASGFSAEGGEENLDELPGLRKSAA